MAIFKSMNNGPVRQIIYKPCKPYVLKKDELAEHREAEGRLKIFEDKIRRFGPEIKVYDLRNNINIEVFARYSGRYN